MMRQRGLQRRTELQRTELSRTPKIPAEDMRQSSAGPVKPRKSPAQPGMAHGRKLVYARSGGWCEVRIPGVCLGHGMSWHHRKNRSQGGTWSPTNGLHACGDGTTGCHGLLTNPNGRREEFLRYGWIVSSFADPALVAVLLRGDRCVLLTDDGRYVAVPQVKEAS